MIWFSGIEQDVPPHPYSAKRANRLRIESLESTFASYACVIDLVPFSLEVRGKTAERKIEAVVLFPICVHLVFVSDTR